MKRHPEELDPETLEPLKPLELGTLTARYDEQTDDKKRKQVDINLDQQRAQDGMLYTQKMQCDLGRLEEIVRRGKEFEQGMTQEPREPHWEKPDRVEIVKPYIANFYESTSPKGTNRVDVHLEREEKGGQKATQDMWCSLDRLKEVVERGLKVEQKLGHDRKWYCIAEPVELLEPGVAKAKVFRSVSDDAQGRLEAHELSGSNRQPPKYVLWPVPQGWEIGKGEYITVHNGPDANVDKHIAIFEADRERFGKQHLVAQWHDRERNPTPEMEVTYDPESGVDYRGVPQDYKVGPAKGSKRPGDPEVPQWVVVDLKERKIVDSFDDKKEAVRCFKELEAMEQARALQRETMEQILARLQEAEQRKATIDLSKESFGPRL